MQETEKLISEVLKRSRLLKNGTAKDLSESGQTMSDIAAQVNSAPKLASALQAVLTAVHGTVSESLDSALVSELTKAVRSANDHCR